MNPISNSMVGMEKGNYAVRISLSADRCADILDNWRSHVEQIIAYEHPSDNAARTHCHMLLLGCRVTTQRLKQLAETNGKGNTFWSFKMCDSNTDKYITYMSKGQYAPFWDVTNEVHYDHKEVEKLCNAWVAPTAPIKPRLVAYLNFEKQIRELPGEHRECKTDIKRLATSYLFKIHGMFTQQVNNDIVNYANTYVYKYKISPI